MQIVSLCLIYANSKRTVFTNVAYHFWFRRRKKKKIMNSLITTITSIGEKKTRRQKIVRDAF